MKDLKNRTLAWVDIETTGTDEDKDAILELGIVVTPMPNFDDPDYQHGWYQGVPDLGVLASFTRVCRPSRDVSLHNISPYVWNLHQENGLWNESMNSEDSFEDIIREGAHFMKQHQAFGSPMCGNSIHFDRRFLQAGAPDFVKLFHYRNLDVSSIKNMVNHHLGQVPPWQEPAKKPHRVLEDLHNTLEEYRYYLGCFAGGLACPS